MDAKKLFIFWLLFGVFLMAACEPDEIPNLSPTSTIRTFSTAANTEIPSSAPAVPAPAGTRSTPQLPEGVPPIQCLNAGLPETACTGATANQDWEPFIREFNQVEMVLVPAGCFRMGNDDGYPEEQPAHEICFNEPFWIDRTEVTAAQFASFLNGQPEPVEEVDAWLVYMGRNDDDYNYQFVKEGSDWRPINQEENRPLGYISWVGANDYCAWRGARLPTEAEWEYAARGPESYLYPWGNELVMDNFAITRERLPDVGSFPQGASWVGALDMACSLFEWTSSLYKPYPYRADDGREAGFEVDSTGYRVFRGSHWFHSDQEWDNISTTPRYEIAPDIAYWDNGLRCARSIDW